jgi:UDP-glucose 4-epimerase
MRVLVTGGGGYIGRRVVARLAARGDTAIAFDSVLAPPLLALADDVPSIVPFAGDITSVANLAQAFRAHRPDAVIHLAAQVGQAQSVGNPVSSLDINIIGSLNVMEAMRLYDVRRMLHLSSEEVYGDMVDLTPEDHPKDPFLAYGISKLAVEQFIRSYNELHGLDGVSLRTSWVYSPGLPRPRPPNTLIDAALAGRSLHLPGGADTYWDFTYMDDLVDGILLALDHAGNHPFDVYNVASGTRASLAEMAAIVRDLVPGADITVGNGPYRHAGGYRLVRKGALDVGRARSVFGYAPRYDLRRGLERYVEEARSDEPL